MLGNGKKMLIVPVVALVMCAAAFAGIAYAYTSSLTSDKVTPTSDYFDIDMYAANGTDLSTVPIAVAISLVTFTTSTDYSLAENNVTITANSVAAKVATAYLKVNENSTGVTQAYLNLTVNVPTFTGILAGLTVTPSFVVKEGGNVVNAVAEGTYAGQYLVTTNTLITVEITLTVAGTTSWNTTVTANYPSADDAVQAYQSAFNTQAYYALSVTATPKEA